MYENIYSYKVYIAMSLYTYIIYNNKTTYFKEVHIYHIWTCYLKQIVVAA